MINTIKSNAINDYYELYEYFNNTVPIVNGLSIYIAESCRKVDRTQIRRNLSELNLLVYAKHLRRMNTLPNVEKDKFIVSTNPNLTLNIVIQELESLRDFTTNVNRAKLLNCKMIIDSMLGR